MTTIRIEAEKHDPEKPNEWRVKIFIDKEPPIQEVKNTSILPQYIECELLNLFAKEAG